MIKTLAFGCGEQFICDKRTEAYRKYVEGVFEQKIVASAKISRGATCSAGWQAREVQVF